MIQRNLDGVYFRVCRDGKWCNVCFSDLTQPEREEVTANRSAEWLRSLAYCLADTLQTVGEQFNIMGDD